MSPPCGPHLANRTVPALSGPPWPAPGQPVSPKSACLNLPRMDSEMAWIYSVVADTVDRAASLQMVRV